MTGSLPTRGITIPQNPTGGRPSGPTPDWNNSQVYCNVTATTSAIGGLSGPSVAG
jgi:hypothetical protein